MVVVGVAATSSLHGSLGVELARASHPRLVDRHRRGGAGARRGDDDGSDPTQRAPHRGTVGGRGFGLARLEVGLYDWVGHTGGMSMVTKRPESG
jgi:hypothetical protein